MKSAETFEWGERAAGPLLASPDPSNPDAPSGKLRARNITFSVSVLVNSLPSFDCSFLASRDRTSLELEAKGSKLEVRRLKLNP